MATWNVSRLSDGLVQARENRGQVDNDETRSKDRMDEGEQVLQDFGLCPERSRGNRQKSAIHQPG